MVAIVIELTIAATPEHVWAALTLPDEIGHWWTNDLNFEAEVGTLAEFRFGEWGDFAFLFEVAEMDESSKLHWISRLSPMAYWAGTSVTWQLTPVHDGTEVIFTHEGFIKKDEAYEWTQGNWDYFLASLKSYLETGQGTPGVLPSIKQGLMGK